MSLTEAGEEAIRLLGGQLRAVRLVAEQRELTPAEKAYALALLQRSTEMEGTRGRLVLEALKLEAPAEQKRALLRAFSGETSQEFTTSQESTVQSNPTSSEPTVGATAGATAWEQSSRPSPSSTRPSESETP